MLKKMNMLLVILSVLLVGCSSDKTITDKVSSDTEIKENIEVIQNESVDQTDETKEETKQEVVIENVEEKKQETQKESSKIENKENTNKTQNNTKQPVENKKPTEVKESIDDKENKEPEVEITKPVEPTPEVPKEDLVPKEEEKKEEVVIKAYLSRDTLNYINKERSKLGLSPLTWDSSLENAVLTRAKETDQNYSHTRPNGSKWTTVLPNKDSMQLYGEIITNRFSPYDAVQAWMNSPSHKESMLDPDKTHGVVAVYNDVYVCITVKYFD